jgi:hypothetical protein
MPRPSEEKYMNFLKMYETQRERQEKHIGTLESELNTLDKRCVELENTNYALSKGSTK